MARAACLTGLIKAKMRGKTAILRISSAGQSRYNGTPEIVEAYPSQAVTATIAKRPLLGHVARPCENQKSKYGMKNLCTGSRRKVIATRHKLKILPSRHMTAVCPVCQRAVAIRRLLGVLEFSRHKGSLPAKPVAKKPVKRATKSVKRRK